MSKFNIGNYKLPHMSAFPVKKAANRIPKPIRPLPTPPMPVPVPLEKPNTTSSLRQNDVDETIGSAGISNDSTDAVQAWKNFKSAYINRKFKGNNEKLGPITPEENLAEYNREKNEFYYDTNTKKLRLTPTDDAEMKDQRFLDTLDSFQLPPED